MDLPHTTRPALKRLYAAALAAGVAWCVWPADAQPLPLERKEPLELRGRIGEGRSDSPNRRMSTGQDSTSMQEASRYQPVSAGAVGAETDASEPRPGASVFEESDRSADIFENPLERRQAARPRSARERAAAPLESETGRLDEAERAQPDDEPERITRVGPVEPDDPDIVGAVDPLAARVDPIESSVITPEENPYAPIGLRLGTFNVTTTLDQVVGYSTNPNFSQGGRGATISETDLRVAAVSDWSRHQMRIDGYGTYRKSLSGERIEDREAGIDAALDLDLIEGYGGSATLGYAIRPESASSPIDFTGVLDRPVRQTLTGSLGVSKDEGKLRLAARGSVERSWYGDAELQGGGTLSQQDRNYTLAATTLRAGYEVSPALVPFVEGEIGRRFYELDVDSNGFERSSNRIGLRAGAEIDLGEKLNGEFSAGWLRETLDDDRLAPVSGPTANLALAWSPQRGTIVRMLGSTTVEGTTTAGASGSVLYSGTIAVDRELRDNLTASASIGGYFRDYAGTNGEDMGFVAEASTTWWLNRYLGLTGRARYETLKSNLPGRDADVASIFGGIRLQR